MSLQTHTATLELHVAAPDGQGLRALSCLLADVGQLQGLVPVSLNACGDGREEALVRFEAPDGANARVTAVLHPRLMGVASDEGLLLINSAEPIESGTVRSLDANGIAAALGIPVYLPMVGAVARAAGWLDLARVKAAVRLALQSTAPYWVEPGIAGVEAGFMALN